MPLLRSCRWQTGDNSNTITSTNSRGCLAATPKTLTNQCKLNNINYDSTKFYTHESSNTTVTSQTLPPQRTKPQNYVVATEHPPGNQKGNEPLPSLNCCKNRPTDIQKSEQGVTTTITGDTIIPPLATTTPLFEEGLVRDEQTIEVDLPLTSTVVLKRKQKNFL